ncbi:MAG: YiiD C-terminal domain-containing protein [Alcanivoracaceae bacterium]|nr:YiiD C-terminal domain-containing protein [Alcanivoracaceae bacterium]
MIDLAALQARVCEAIPITRGLSFELLDFDGDRLRVSAPLSANGNDKGTFFAGSQAMLLTLSGWALTTLLAEQAGYPSDVVAVESALSYCAPVCSDMVVTVSASEGQQARFAERLARKGRAPLAVDASGVDQAGVEGARFRASYLARYHSPDAGAGKRRETV